MTLRVRGRAGGIAVDVGQGAGRGLAVEVQGKRPGTGLSCGRRGLGAKRGIVVNVESEGAGREA